MEQVEIHLMEIWNGLKVATNVYLSSNLNKKKNENFGQNMLDDISRNTVK